jgi:hypothetical protein
MGYHESEIYTPRVVSVKMSSQTNNNQSTDITQPSAGNSNPYPTTLGPSDSRLSTRTLGEGLDTQDNPFLT